MPRGFNRREVLVWGAGAALMPAALRARAPLAPPGLDRDSDPDSDPDSAAFAALDAYVERHLAEMGAPGLTLGLAGRGRPLRAASYGWRDLATRAPLAPGDLFQIGSISKSFVALALLRLREEGKVDLDRPIRDYLPWLRVESPHAPITVHHLLTHTSGLPGNLALFPGDPERPLWVGGPPGERFRYCNLGYQILGFLLASLDGGSLGDVLRRRVLVPAGMAASAPVIGPAIRARLAASYQPLYDDRPLPRGGALVEAPRLTFDNAAGSVASTPGDMARYLHVLLNRGRGVVSPESFDLFARPWVAAPSFGEGAHYGYGIAVTAVDGRTVLRHTGGMVAFSSALHADLDAGVGAFASVNANLQGYRPNAVAAYALALLRASRDAGAALPEAPPANDPFAIENAADYAGLYTAPDGGRLEIVATGGALHLLHRGERLALERRGGRDSFLSTHPDFALFTFDFGRRDERVVEVGHGGSWWAGAAYDGAREFAVPDEWRAYVGLYHNDSPWEGSARVVVRKDQLLVAGEVLTPLAPGRFRLGEDETTPERVRFDAIVGGRAMRADVSGTVYRRMEE